MIHPGGSPSIRPSLQQGTVAVFGQLESPQVARVRRVEKQIKRAVLEK